VAGKKLTQTAPRCWETTLLLPMLAGLRNQARTSFSVSPTSTVPDWAEKATARFEPRSWLRRLTDAPSRRSVSRSEPSWPVVISASGSPSTSGLELSVAEHGGVSTNAMARMAAMCGCSTWVGRTSVAPVRRASPIDHTTTEPGQGIELQPGLLTLLQGDESQRLTV